MSKSLDYILRELSMPFHLTVINTDSNLKRNISNVRIVEHMDSIPHIKENELIITTGIMLTQKENFILFCRQLLAQKVQGLIVNIGPYISSIPAGALNAFGKELPFITLPWEMDTIDLERAIYALLLDKHLELTSASDYLKNYLLFPEQRPVLLKQLENLNFKGSTRLCSFIITFAQADDCQFILANQIIKIAYDASPNYIAFSHENSITLLFTQLNELSYKTLLRKLSKVIIGAGNTASLLIGPTEVLLNEFASEYFHMLSYSQISLKKQQNISNYKDMNLYNLLLSLQNTNYLDELYATYYGKLKSYDDAEGTTLCSLLSDLFACNLSRAELSEKRFLHRNTIQYQLNKIEGILNCNIKNPHDICCLYLSYLYHCYFLSETD